MQTNKYMDTEIDVLAEYTGKDGKREWKDVGSWLRPGECIAVIEVENLEQARLLGMSGEREADLRGEIERLTTALKKAREVLDECRDNINPERGYADELERDVSEAIATINEVLK